MAAAHAAVPDGAQTQRVRRLRRVDPRPSGRRADAGCGEDDRRRRRHQPSPTAGAVVDPADRRGAVRFRCGFRAPLHRRTREPRRAVRPPQRGVRATAKVGLRQSRPAADRSARVAREQRRGPLARPAHVHADHAREPRVPRDGARRDGVLLTAGCAGDAGGDIAPAHHDLSCELGRATARR